MNQTYYNNDIFNMTSAAKIMPKFSEDEDVDT